MKGDAVRPVSVRYMGFRSTSEGREYTLRVVEQGEEPRESILVIPHEAFASREVRFQDAPDLCFTKLQRDLAGENATAAGARLVLTSADLAAYRENQSRKSPERKRTFPLPSGDGGA